MMWDLLTISPSDFRKGKIASGGRKSSMCSQGTLLTEPVKHCLFLLVSGTRGIRQKAQYVHQGKLSVGKLARNS